MAIKMIAVWGSPSCGKTITSLALATEIANNNKNVVVINTDTIVPALAVYLPRKTDLTNDNSIGSLFSQKTINYEDLAQKIFIHPKSERIGFMGLVSGETPLTYNSFEREKMLELLRVFDKTAFDYLIFDCLSNPTQDELTFLALEAADYVFRIISPDVKGIEFNKAQNNWLRGAGNIDVDNHIKVCCGYRKKVSPIDQVKAIYSYDYLIPYSEEAESKYIAGELFKKFSTTAGIEFQKVIAKLVKERLLTRE